MSSLQLELEELLNRGDFLRAYVTLSKISNPSLSVEKYVEKIRELSAQTWNHYSLAKKDTVQKLKAINAVLFDDYEIIAKSDKYKALIDDPNRCYLHQLIEKKMGNPLSITVLYFLICQQLGIASRCIALPSYFLLQLEEFDYEFYVDPFDRGKLLTHEEFQRKFRAAVNRQKIAGMSAGHQLNLYERLDSGQLLARLLQQLKHIFILKGNPLEALRTVEALSLFYPDSPELTRDRGVLYCEMEYFSKALEDLKIYLKARPRADDFVEIKKLAKMLKGYREILN